MFLMFTIFCCNVIIIEKWGISYVRKTWGNWKRYNEIEEELANPEIISDIKKMTELSKERTSLEKTVEVYNEYKKVLSDIEEAKKMLHDKDMVEFAKEELAEAEIRKKN